MNINVLIFLGVSIIIIYFVFIAPSRKRKKLDKRKEDFEALRFETEFPQHIKIIEESVDIINKTKNIETGIRRFDTITFHLEKAVALFPLAQDKDIEIKVCGKSIKSAKDIKAIDEVKKMYIKSFSNKKTKQVFLDHDGLKYIGELRRDGKFEQAEKLLLKAEPSPAVADEMRKLASIKAKAAKKTLNWEAVVEHLEGYIEYANKCRKHCLETVSQEPPGHTKSDLKLLQLAKEELSNKIKPTSKK